MMVNLLPWQQGSQKKGDGDDRSAGTMGERMLQILERLETNAVTGDSALGMISLETWLHAVIDLIFVYDFFLFLEIRVRLVMQWWICILCWGSFFGFFSLKKITSQTWIKQDKFKIHTSYCIRVQFCCELNMKLTFISFCR